MKRCGVINILWVLFPISFFANNQDKFIESWINEYIGFEKNLGQISNFEGEYVSNVFFRAKLPGYGIFITEKGVSYVIYKGENFARIDIELINSKILKDNIEYEDILPGYSNYYLPSCPDGILGVITYKKVRIKEVYPGIDWIWKYEDDKLHHEFEIKPYADIKKLKMKVKYADYEIKENGKKLIFSTPIGKIEDGEILAYEGLREVDVSYKEESGVISFNVKNYSGKSNLIIDPPLSLLWATYYGGNDSEGSYSITTDANGNVFVAGATESINFPTHNPGQGAYYQGIFSGVRDVFILRFENSGIRKWATYYGGCKEEASYSITRDADGNIFVTGATESTDFPTYNPGQGAYYQGSLDGGLDVFILKFDSSGIRKWATYYGGNNTDWGSSIITDPNGNVFVTGSTYSEDFPTYNPGQGAYYQGSLAGPEDGFILKFNNSGVRKWATYYGGESFDWGHSVITDQNGNVFVTGTTWSDSFPTYNPGQGAYYQGSLAGEYDVFILKFDSSGIRKWATYYGGNYVDAGYSIIVDPNRNVFVTGVTSSDNFPTYNPGQGAYYQGSLAGIVDVFILKFDSSGIRKWATYYGGDSIEYSWFITITTDPNGNIFITGSTNSTNFPTYNPGQGAYYQGSLAGNYDVFILGFENSGVRKWATYYGGTGEDRGMSITTDPNGNIFVTGVTNSNNFPTYDPGQGAYYQGSLAGDYDAFILKFASSFLFEKDFPSYSENNLHIIKNLKSIKIIFEVDKPCEIGADIYHLDGSLFKRINYGHSQKGRYMIEIRFDEISKKGIYFIKAKTGKNIKRIKFLNF